MGWAEERGKGKALRLGVGGRDQQEGEETRGGGEEMGCEHGQEKQVTRDIGWDVS